MKRMPFILLGSLLLLAGGLSACQQATEIVEERETAGESSPEAKPGLSLTDGRLMLPVLKGRPGAAYFTLRNTSEEVVTIAGVHVEGAESAEMHETNDGVMAKVDSLEITPGRLIEFSPGGLHVMAFSLSDDLKAGGTTEITVTFSDGDKLSAPLEIKTMGGDEATQGTEEKEDMDHGDMH